MGSEWRRKAGEVIERALAEGRARGLEGRELVRHVDSAYPFGPRENHPYQMWLKERRFLLGDLLRRPRRPATTLGDLRRPDGTPIDVPPGRAGA